MFNLAFIIISDGELLFAPFFSMTKKAIKLAITNLILLNTHDVLFNLNLVVFYSIFFVHNPRCLT